MGEGKWRPLYCVVLEQGRTIGSVSGPFKTRAQATRAAKEMWPNQDWNVRMLNDYTTPTGRPMTLYYEELVDPTLRKRSE